MPRDNRTKLLNRDDGDRTDGAWIIGVSGSWLAEEGVGDKHRVAPFGDPARPRRRCWGKCLSEGTSPDGSRVNLLGKTTEKEKIPFTGRASPVKSKSHSV